MDDIRLGVVDGVVSPDLCVVFEPLRRDIWRKPYYAGLRVVGGDDQQVGIAGRELLEGLPLISRSLVFGFRLTREHVMCSASEHLSVGVLARNISTQRPWRHGEG